MAYTHTHTHHQDHDHGYDYDAAGIEGGAVVEEDGAVNESSAAVTSSSTHTRRGDAPPASVAKRLRLLAESAETPPRRWYLTFSENRSYVALAVFVTAILLLVWMRPLFVLVDVVDDEESKGEGKDEKRMLRRKHKSVKTKTCGGTRISRRKLIAWSAGAAALAWMLPLFMGPAWPLGTPPSTSTVV